MVINNIKIINKYKYNINNINIKNMVITLIMLAFKSVFFLPWVLQTYVLYVITSLTVVIIRLPDGKNDKKRQF